MRHTPVRAAAVAPLAHHPAVVASTHAAAVDVVVPRAQARAPVDTGAGAASIHAESHVDASGAYVERVSWDREHDYMRFAELGTVHETARPFLRPAALE